MLPEPKTLKQSNPPAELSRITGVKNLNTEKPSTFSVCERCELRDADSLLGRLCHVCYGELRFDALPERRKRQELLTVTPKKFIAAELRDLSPALSKILTAATETGVVLWGAAGVGKTYALCALAKSLVITGLTVRRVNYELLCLKLRDTFKAAAKSSEWEVIEPLVGCDALFIEDLGASRGIDSKETDFSLRTLLLLVDLRMESCRPTYISTNKSVENLARSFDSRIGDRLRTFAIIKMSGASKRRSAQKGADKNGKNR